MFPLRALRKQISSKATQVFFSTSKRSNGEFEFKIHEKALHADSFGIDILHAPLFNKGTGFTQYERDRLGLEGLLPPVIKTLDQQLARVKEHLSNIKSDVEKNMYLQSLHNRNETLYYRVLVDDIASMAPLVYTPTVGIVCQQFGNQFRRSRGMYFTKNNIGQMSSLVNNWPHDDVHVIVVTDGSRILGLGDLGVNGMGIPIGKLALYCAAGGIAPHRVLPVMLDVGTNNSALLDDPHYLGMKHARLEGQQYFDVVDEFIQAAFSKWPDVIVQFEDFETSKAVPLLARYRNQYRVFNDDIQGTGSVTLSCLLSAARNSGSRITDLKVLCAGAGSAGRGVCDTLMQGMVQAGLTEEEARSRFVLVTKDGVIGSRNGPNGDPHFDKKTGSSIDPGHHEWATDELPDGTSLLEAAKQFQPNVLLGLSTVSGLFDEELIRTVASFNAKPIIMPMSNPTSRAECTPENAYLWTDGRAVVATGSPFDPVTLPDGRTLTPSQCNNMYIFPGLGLAASVSGVRKITDRMLFIAAQACTNSMTYKEMQDGRTFPDIHRIREVSKNVAVAVIKEAIDQDMATKIGKKEIREGIEALVSRKMYYPKYVPIEPGNNC
jgi:malate dehydrogenase (oxaloacetate-decarboxylating)(NADP+)